MAEDETSTWTSAVLQNAGILAEFYTALRDARVPDALAFELVSDYHREVLLAGEIITIEDE